MQIIIADVELFASLTEGIETTSSLIARYTIIEEFYLRHDLKATSLLQEAIEKLYAATLTYLAQVKAYFSGNTGSMSLLPSLVQRVAIY